MARVFSTDFNYRNSYYTALVTITGHNEESVITIHVPDRELHNFLPGGKIIVNPEKKILTEGNKHTPDKDLINALLSAVEKHENTEPGRDIWS
jgi:hypothetical protein